MEFKRKGLVYLGVSNIVSKKGKELTFVRLGDREKFQSYDFLLSSKYDADLNMLFKSNDLVDVTVDFSNFNGRSYVTLLDVKKG